MRASHVFLGFLIVTLAGALGLSFALSAPPALVPMDADAGAALSAQWATLATAAPGAPFEIAAAPSAWAGWLSRQVANPRRSPVAGIALRAGADQAQLDIRLRGIFVFTTRLAITFSATPAADGLHFHCTALTVGRLRLPASLCAPVSHALEAAWQRWAADWQVDRVEMSAERIRVAGRRR